MAKVQGAPKAAPKAKSKNRGIYLKSVRAGKCFRHNQGECKVAFCPYPHECSICGEEGCAAIKHKEE